MTTNPRVLVPLPIVMVGALDPSTPLARHTRTDLTPFLEEWATLLLDPVAALESMAGDLLDFAGWDAAGYAQVSASTARLLREAGRSEVVVAALADRKKSIVVRTPDADGDRLSLDPSRSMPLLAGLAVGVALTAAVGRDSRTVLQAQVQAAQTAKRQRRARETAREQAERRSASGASEAAPAHRPVQEG